MKTTPMPTIYDRNYRKLLQLIPHLADLQVGHYLRFEAGKAFMPLSVDTLDREGTRLCIALSHHFEQNGDLVADPDMELRVDLEDQTVEALTSSITRSTPLPARSVPISSRASR